MATAEQLRNELEAKKDELLKARAEADAAHDAEALKKIDEAIEDVDSARVDLALGGLAEVAARINTLRAKIEAATRKATSWPFGALDAPDNHERPFRAVLQDNDFADQGPDQPPPAPTTMPADTVPSVSPGWANNYQQLWSTMTILPQRQKEADAIAKKIVGNQTRYAAAVAGTSVPWWFIAVVHSMECSLRFDQHLHNGDPLSARTVRVPRGRPAAGSPPFTWEASASDSIEYEKLDKVTDWSLTNVLFNWHRYNGINNEYKRRGIPTPYLWSGSQHYRKGKYVRDGEFDPEAVSAQIGAAVLLKALIGLGAVTIGPQLAIQSNPAAATGHAASLDIDLSGPAFAHLAAELDYPGLLKVGSGKNAAERKGVRRVQEWLNIHDLATAIDEDFKDSTGEQLTKFQTRAQRQPTGELDPETWVLLTAPLRRALASIDHGASSSLEDAILRVAQQHIDQKPIEVGGNNCGPWVRTYMKGSQGADQKWCAGFVCFIVAQAARDLGVPIPFKRQVGVDELVADGKTAGRFIGEQTVASTMQRRSNLRPGYIFVVRESANDWVHTGIVKKLNDQTFDTLEGNTGGDNGTDGANARAGNRSYAAKDFLRVI